MNIARILYPVKVLGPGNRIGIWVCGCPRRCSGCSNPELWEKRLEYEIALPIIKELIEKITVNHTVDGFTITGGEPMSQPKELAELINYLKTISSDIIVYTGYEYNELLKLKSETIEEILGSIAVLIDGQYLEERNNNVILRGSDNQKIIILSQQYMDNYENYLKTAHNKIQNFTTTDGVISVGIHKRYFANEICSLIYENNGGNSNV